jgi:AcrR family transcriptional regulator
MTVPTAGRRPLRATRPGLRRGSLTPERIVDESLKLLDEQGVVGFSLPRLGRALGADPTAVYRHFASKDDVVLAIADRLIEEAMAGMEPRACWVDTVIEVTGRLRAVYLAHPAAASLSASRTTHGPGEMKAINLLIGAVREAGFEGAEAVRIYRALGDFAVYWAGGEAGFLALDERAQATERVAWAAYLVVDRAEFPQIWQVRLELPEVADDAIFDTILSLVIDGLMRRAPRACACGAHRPGPNGSG